MVKIIILSLQYDSSMLIDTDLHKKEKQIYIRILSHINEYSIHFLLKNYFMTNRL